VQTTDLQRALHIIGPGLHSKGLVKIRPGAAVPVPGNRCPSGTLEAISRLLNALEKDNIIGTTSSRHAA
jgi:hypothetical protein